MFNPQPKKKRIKLPPQKYLKLKIQVWERDNYICQVCRESTLYYTTKGERRGSPPHHLVKRSQGGDDTMENLVTVCTSCHDLIEEKKIPNPKPKLGPQPPFSGDTGQSLSKLRSEKRAMSDGHST